MSARTVAEKLRIKPGTSLWSSHPERVGLIGPLPEGVHVVDGLAGAGAALVFADDAASLRAIVAAHAGDLRDREVVWVAYPKGNRADLNRDTLWPVLAEHGLRPIGQVSVDDVWSALRFRALAPGEVFRGGAAA